MHVVCSIYNYVCKWYNVSGVKVFFDKGPSPETLDITFHISVAHQLLTDILTINNSLLQYRAPNDTRTN